MCALLYFGVLDKRKEILYFLMKNNYIYFKLFENSRRKGVMAFPKDFLKKSYYWELENIFKSKNKQKTIL